MSVPKTKTKTLRQSPLLPSLTMPVPAKMTTSANQIKASPKSAQAQNGKNLKKAPALKPSANQVKPKPLPKVLKEEKKVRYSWE